jgi:hypothetical protein
LAVASAVVSMVLVVPGAWFRVAEPCGFTVATQVAFVRLLFAVSVSYV